MSRIDDILAEAGGMFDLHLPFTLKDGEVKLYFAAGLKRVRSVLGPGNAVNLIVAAGPDALPLLTTAVQVVVGSDRQVSARFDASECNDLFDGKWPCDDTYDRILQAVTERKRYPIPAPVRPGIEGKPPFAQGQTKKEGSHSQDKHK